MAMLAGLSGRLTSSTGAALRTPPTASTAAARAALVAATREAEEGRLVPIRLTLPAMLLDGLCLLKKVKPEEN
jgi:hypothetical protein